MKEIKYIEVDGLLYPDLKLAAQKEVHLSRCGKMKLIQCQDLLRFQCIHN